MANIALLFQVLYVILYMYIILLYPFSNTVFWDRFIQVLHITLVYILYVHSLLSEHVDMWLFPVFCSHKQVSTTAAPRQLFEGSDIELVE